MPAHGTKQIELEGRKVFMPAEEVELEEIIRGGVAAQQAFNEAKAQLDYYKELAIARAKARRSSGKSVRLDALRAGSAVVTFAMETRVVDAKVRALRDELPDATFSAIFVERTTFALTKGIRKFMETPQVTDSEKLKVKIAAVIDVRPKAPSVKFLEEGERVSEEPAEDA